MILTFWTVPKEKPLKDILAHYKSFKFHDSNFYVKAFLSYPVHRQTDSSEYYVAVMMKERNYS